VGWPARFAVCDEVLGRLAVHDPVAVELERGWRSLVASGGLMPVERLAAETGYSRQHLTRRFRDEFGLPPKRAGRVIRFERAKQMLTSAPSFVTIGQVAAACGYADHAHLVREVAEMAGCTPSELVGRQVPFVQDGPGPRG
jgi:AraC-like DNA-binding protein